MHGCACSSVPETPGLEVANEFRVGSGVGIDLGAGPS